ncbi:MAG: S-layer homology domain-containing protein [Clostridiales bacterium]|nr:S-layer homology domain-containing protein [Clostridiales bacterium]
MKRVVSMLLAGLLSLTIIGTAKAFADFTDTGDLNAAQTAAVEKLSRLNVITGYPDGSFRPAADVTRAELAKIICIYAAQTELTEAKNFAFDDVLPGAWYYGWVNRAVECGYVNGYPDGSYLPQNSVTQQEAAAMLLKTENVDTFGFAWPDDFIQAASDLGMLRGFSFSGAAKASRLQICMMINNIITAEDVNAVPPVVNLTDGLHIGMVKSASERDFTLWHTEEPLQLDSTIRRAPKENTMIYFAIKDGTVESWTLLLDTANGSITPTTALKYRAVKNGPYSWVATRTGNTVTAPVDLNAAQPLVRYVSYRNIAVGPNSLDNRNYWLDDECQIYEVVSGRIMPGNRASIEVEQIVTLLVNDEDEVLFLICWK